MALSVDKMKRFGRYNNQPLVDQHSSYIGGSVVQNFPSRGQKILFKNAIIKTIGTIMLPFQHIFLIILHT